MSRLLQLITYARTNGPITINDLLTENNYVDPAQRSSARTQLSRALEEDGEYRELAVNGTILPSASSARISKWEHGLQRHQDKHPVIIQSHALQPARDIRPDNYSLELKDSLNAVIGTNLTGSKGIAVATAMVNFDHALELERVKREAAEEILRTERQARQKTEQMLEVFTNLVSSGGLSLVPKKNRNAEPAGQPDGETNTNAD